VETRITQLKQQAQTSRHLKQTKLVEMLESTLTGQTIRWSEHSARLRFQEPFTQYFKGMADQLAQTLAERFFKSRK
jgi:hypothetical protein